MKSSRCVLSRVLPPYGTLWTVLLVVVIEASAVCAGVTPTNVVVWDTSSRFGDTIDIGNRTRWKAVPTDPFTLEADPAKAFSDPGYYGREYAFGGDAVVENGLLTAVFQSAKGRIAVYSRTDPSQEVMGISLLQADGDRCAVLRNTDGEVALEILSGKDVSAVVAFDRTETIAITPGAKAKGIRVQSSIDYGVAPDFIADDLIIAPAQYPSASTLHVPAESLFLGLLTGENRVLVMTWPKGEHEEEQMRLGLGGPQQGARCIQSIEFEADGASVYLAVLETPGIWHREPLTASFLEKDVTIGWKRPFAARWVTQLDESGLKTRFPFRDTKGQIWRGVPGMYTYPVWFDGDKTCYRLSKKVAPKGDSLIYFLEGQEASAPTRSPVDIMQSTLGRPTCDAILDLPGRRLRTHHRRGAEGIRRACTCGCTEAIEAVFKEGQEVEKRQYIEGAVGDMVYFVTRHMDRIDEYRTFADTMLKCLQMSKKYSPELKPYFDNLEQIAAQIPAQYEVQKENIKSKAYADELAARTIALTRKKDPKNLQTCLELGKEWRGMGGAQDGLLAEYHMIVRRLSQEAGYGCLTQPGQTKDTRNFRAFCRQCLRNPDGYEIWPDY
ncbi:MAG: hypothetical protein KBE65_12315 [Phycisphaerae bacterium]|nr:hypothetical protein [Phycisphaerae bacterium]